MLDFEEQNVQAYRLLLRIEVALRECLKHSMKSQFGMTWQKRLPGDLLTKIKKSQSDESRPQFGFIRWGPLYYLTFAELITLLKQQPGASVAKMIGGDLIVKQLENAFVPRNALCHSRPVSAVGLKVIETLYAEIEAAVTTEVLNANLTNLDVGITQGDAAKEMISALKHIQAALRELPSTVVIPDVFQLAMTQYWWTDDLLAGFDRQKVSTAIDIVRGYNEVPQGIGSAANRQRYCDRNEVTGKLGAALAELEGVQA